MIHPYLNCRGGAERKIIHLANHLYQKGNKVDIYVYRFSKEDTFYEYLNDNIKIIIIGENKITNTFKLIFNAIYKKYDLCICSNYPAHFNGYILKKLGLVKSITWICNEVHSKLNPPKTLFKKIILKFEKNIVKKLDGVISNSKNTYQEILQHFKVQSSIVYPGINTNINTQVKLSKEPYFLSISRVTEDKNISFLEEILSKSNKKIIFCGDGNMRDYLIDLDRKYRHFNYHYDVNDIEKYQLYRNASLFLFLPKNEPFGVTILESISLGTPVIAFNSGGPKEIILDKKNGTLCNSEEIYISTLNTFNSSMLECSPKYYEDYIKKYFSLNVMLESLEKNCFVN